MAINFTEGDATETFTITHQIRYNRTISVSNPTTYIIPITSTQITPNGNNSNIEIPVPINKGGTSAVESSTALFNLGIDISNKQDGSVLAYKTSTGKFEATNEPIKLSISGGFF